MIGEYKIGRTTRRCSVSNRPLLPGEYYYSVVSGDEDEFHRVEISAAAWTGPPEGCLGHWKNRVPLPEEKKRELAPPEVLIELLRSMAEQPAQTKMRYLLALMLLRKRHLKPFENASLIASQPDRNAESSDDEDANSDTTTAVQTAVQTDGQTAVRIEGQTDGQTDEHDAGKPIRNVPVAASHWQLESNLDGSVLSIEVCDIGAGEAESLQAQLVDMLYRDVE